MLRGCALFAAALLLNMAAAHWSGAAADTNRIAALVNRVPITSNDIARRIALLNLRNVTGDLDGIARKELIEESLHLQEARRLGVNVPVKDIELAYRQFATGNNMTFYDLDGVLNESGVSVREFKNYIRANLTWQRLVALRFRAESEQQAVKPLAYLYGGEGDDVIETTQYALKHIVFVIPKAKLEELAGARLVEANNFRARFTGCAGVFDLAKKFRDVTVIDRKRIPESELSEQWRSEVKAAAPGQLTRALRGENGIELFAVCKVEKLRASSDSEPKSSFSVAEIGDDLAALEKKYNDELHESAIISER